MMFARADRSVLATWWWTVDRWLLLMTAMLLIAGLLANFAASPVVALKREVGEYYYVKRQILFLLPAIGMMAALSLMSARGVRRLAILALPLALLATAATLLVGAEVKGATRWLQLGAFTLQPTEFLKPLFIIVSAWLLAIQIDDPRVPAKGIATAIFALAALLMFQQPDFGQIALLGTIFIGQLVLAGLSARMMMITAATAMTIAVLGYTQMPHVAQRIDAYLNPQTHDTYQSDRAIDAFRAGGVTGRTPGQETVKQHLPDAHTDYVFAVVGEEFGALGCLALLLAYGMIVLRGLSFLLREQDPFILLAAGGLVMQIGLQAAINVGVTLGMLPPKGMTLPFISYGGSSLLALALSVGMLLALTRCKRYARTADVFAS